MIIYSMNLQTFTLLIAIAENLFFLNLITPEQYQISQNTCIYTPI